MCLLVKSPSNKKLMNQRWIWSVMLLLLPFPLLSQQGELGNWLMYFGANKVSDKISLHTEAQYRNHEVVPNTIEQLLLRTGVNYHINPNAFATVGYANITSHVYESEQSNPESTEHRIWQQFIMTNNVGRVKFEHRYRTEQRWVNDTDLRHRFRYRIMAFIPLNNMKIEPKTWFLGLYDEVFVNAERTRFDRNRLYGALGYQLNKTTGVQVGMLHQETQAFGKWYLQFACVFNPDLRRKAEE